MNTISFSGKATLVLSEHITIHSPLEINFIIEQDSSITLIDDTHHLHNQSRSFIFTIKARAYLLYRYRFTAEEQTRRNSSPRTEAGKEPTLLKNLTIRLSEPEAKAHIECISEIFGHDYCVFKTLQHHEAPHTESLVITRTVAHDASRSLSENLIRIEKNAIHTKAREETKSLLLGEKARVISYPKLEVEADIVSCEHGAAIARLREDDFFYFQSRGIPRKTAQSLLVDAFLKHTL